ncbi:MAG: hypothetical protein ACRDP6_32530 [Actinoallomurus sp.]
MAELVHDDVLAVKGAAALFMEDVVGIAHGDAESAKAVGHYGNGHQLDLAGPLVFQPGDELGEVEWLGDVKIV